MCFCLTHKYIHFTYVVFILLCVVVNELHENLHKNSLWLKQSSIALLIHVSTTTITDPKHSISVLYLLHKQTNNTESNLTCLSGVHCSMQFSLM